MTVMENEEREIVAAWQPSPSDGKFLVRDIARQQINRYLPSLAVPAIFAAGFDKLLHCFTLFGFIPEWSVPIACCVWMTVSYIARSRRLFRQSTARLSRAGGMFVTREHLILYFLDGSNAEHKSRSAIDRRLTPDGLYFELDERRMFVPARAFATGSDMAGVDAIFEHYARQPRFTHYSPPRVSGVFPVSISYQQTSVDVVHAYYHGWSRSYLRSSEGKNALMICLVPLVLGGVPLLTFVSLPSIIFPLTITTALAAIIGLHTASPAFPISVARRRLPFKKAITIALGEKGVAVRVDEEEEVFLWSVVRKLALDTRFVYIDMPDKFILIPQSVFLDAKHAGEFFASARSYQRGETPAMDTTGAAWPPAPELMKKP